VHIELIRAVPAAPSASPRDWARVAVERVTAPLPYWRDLIAARAACVAREPGPRR
jgi:hypothetical protein